MSEQKQKMTESKKILQEIVYSRWVFARSFLIVFLASSFLLYGIGLTPEEKPIAMGESGIVEVANASIKGSVHLESRVVEKSGVDMVPLRIVIDSVGIDALVLNPQSKDIAVLDNALLSGVVRYPSSGLLGDEANMFLFGHSSFLPSVNNKNFKAFNNLQKVKKGDTIRVESTDMVNLYIVETIRLVDADEALVELSRTGKKLTLSTCNSFGAPGERYIVEASFVESHAL